MPPDVHNEMLLNAAPLQHFGANAAEVVPTVAENAMGRRVEVRNAVLRLTTPEDLADTFGGLRHFAIEARIALAEDDAHLATLLVPAAGLASLLSLELDEDTLDEAIAAPILEQAQATAAEMLDLVTLLLFADTPVQGDMGISEVRLDALEATVEMLAGSSGGAPLFRLDHELVADDTPAVPVTLLIPQPMLESIQVRLEAVAADAEAAPAEPTPITSRPDSETAPTASFADADGDAFEQEAFDDEAIPIAPVRLPDFRDKAAPGVASHALDLILDVQMRVSVELGRATLTVQEILALGTGSVVELDKLAGEPVDILVNDRLIARGEVVMVEENFGVRVTEILQTGQVPLASAAR